MFLQGWINGILINESSVYGTLCVVLLKILNMGLYFSEIDTRGWPYRRQDLLLPFNHSFATIQFDKFLHIMVLYENYLICILMNINENSKNKAKPLYKHVSQGVIRPTFKSLEHLLFMLNGSIGPLKRNTLCSLIINSFW